MLFLRERQFLSRWGLIILAWILIIIVAVIFASGRAHAHGLHLSDMQNQFGPIIMGPSWVDDVGAIVCTEGDFEVKCFRMYKSSDLSHSQVHVAPLTKQQAKRLILLQILKNTNKQGRK